VYVSNKNDHDAYVTYVRQRQKCNNESVPSSFEFIESITVELIDRCVKELKYMARHSVQMIPVVRTWRMYIQVLSRISSLHFLSWLFILRPIYLIFLE
jgi:hypothetical protein